MGPHQGHKGFRASGLWARICRAPSAPRWRNRSFRAPLFHDRAPFSQSQHFCPGFKKRRRLRPFGLNSKTSGIPGFHRAPLPYLERCFIAPFGRAPYHKLNTGTKSSSILKHFFQNLCAITLMAFLTVNGHFLHIRSKNIVQTASKPLYIPLTIIHSTPH